MQQEVLKVLRVLGKSSGELQIACFYPALAPHVLAERQGKSRRQHDMEQQDLLPGHQSGWLAIDCMIPIPPGSILSNH
jgi:hypothetical protein